MPRYNAPEDKEQPREESSSEEEYDENADEDFNPEIVVENENASSSSEDEEEQQSKPVKRPKKRKSDTIGEELDSGDEATIKERKSKKRRKDAQEDDESGGEGGLIRTRAQRVADKEEKKHRKRARDGEVTIDVNGIWADLSSIPVGRSFHALPPPESDDAMDVDDDDTNDKETAAESEEMITIIKRIEYAGIVESREETVPRSSKEAQEYLAKHPEADPKHRMHHVNSSGLLKPMRRPSAFEPNPIGLVKGVAPEKLRLRAPSRKDFEMAEMRKRSKEKVVKMTTVQKSSLDWKDHVQKEGLQDELDVYGRSKKGFLAREAFLDRAAGAREQAARDARSRL